MAAVSTNTMYGDVTIHTWVLTTADATGDAVVIPSDADKSVQIYGTFGSGTLTVQGSNEIGTPANWQSLHRPAGTAIALTAAGIEAIVENCLQYRPVLTGSTAATVTVRLMTRRTR